VIPVSSVMQATEFLKHSRPEPKVVLT
jgi:hypothetical protein